MVLAEMIPEKKALYKRDQDHGYSRIVSRAFPATSTRETSWCGNCRIAPEQGYLSNRT
jgi:hypothetical protein